jgi:hypothetical protein
LQFFLARIFDFSNRPWVVNAVVEKLAAIDGTDYAPQIIA